MESECDKARIRNLQRQFKAITKNLNLLKQCTTYAHFHEAQTHANQIQQIVTATFEYYKQEIFYVTHIAAKNQFQTKKIVNLQKELKQAVDIHQLYETKLQKTLKQRDQLAEENAKLRQQLLRACKQSSIDNMSQRSAEEDIPDYQSLYLSRAEELNKSQLPEKEENNEQEIKEKTQQEKDIMKQEMQIKQIDLILKQSRTKSTKEDQMEEGLFSHDQ